MDSQEEKFDIKPVSAPMPAENKEIEPAPVEKPGISAPFAPPAQPVAARKKTARRIELLFLGFFLSSVMTLLSFIFIYVRYGVDLPDYAQLAEYKPPVTSRFYAGDGSLLTEYATERRIFVELDKIPPHLVNAFISAEDKNFWTHSGIDVGGIVKAGLTNVRSMLTGSSRRIGASTITQQVAKNFLLTNERSMERKIREAILSLKMERAFTKRHILTLYLNQIFLGYRSYGVAAAAQNYFGKALNELTLGESAFLAALPKAPGSYDPVSSRDRAIARRNYVLERMRINGYISREDEEQARAEDIDVVDSFISRRQRYALYFSEDVRKMLADIYGEEQLYSGGLAVRTSLEPHYQEVATRTLRRALINFDTRRGWRGAEKNFSLSPDDYLEDTAAQAALAKGRPLWEILLARADVVSGMEDEGWRRAIVTSVAADEAAIGLRDGTTGAIRSQDAKWTGNTDLRRILHGGDIVFVQKNDAGNFLLRQVPEVNGAMVVLDPHTGRILAMVGGFSYTRSKFNRATQARRQIGSTIKPFIYLSALQTGRYTPSSILLDAPIVLEREDGDLWRPTNYDDVFDGELTFRRSLEKSKNNPTVRLALDVGLRKFIQTVVDFGVYKQVRNPNLSMALGSGDTTLIELTSGFAQLINGGREINLTMVDRVQDRYGTTILRSDSRDCPGCNNGWDEELEPPQIADDRAQLADPVSVYQIVHIMQGVVERGSGWLARIDGRTIAGKTGTTNEQQSVWFVGGTPDLVAGVFIGYDQPQSLGNVSSGGSLAAPIFRDFMTEVLKGRRDTPFRVPPGVTFVRVNRETGRPAQASDNNFNTLLEAFAEGTEHTILDSTTQIRAPMTRGGGNETINLDGIY